MTIHQDARMYAALIDGPERVVHRIREGRRAYLHVARGQLMVDGNVLSAGDALKASGVAELVLERGSNAEVLLFDLA